MAKSFWDRYKTYDGDRGNPDQWRKQAEALVALLDGSVDHLAVLSLSQMPATLNELKKARNKAALSSHPDRGGTDEQQVAVNKAYEVLSVRFEPKVNTTSPKVETQKSDKLIDPPRCVGISTNQYSDAVAELKIDGERFMLYINFDPYKSEKTTSTILSRHKGVSGVYTDRSASVPYITQDAYSSDYTGTVLDGEVFFESFEKTASIMSSGDISQKITYYVFDIPVLKGKDIRKLSLRERRRFLETTVKELNNPHIKIVEQYTGNFEAKFNEVTSQGGEGLIIKDLRCAYGQEWAKLKKSASVSCIVTGYRMGKNKPYIGSFAVSVYHNDKLLEVGYVSGFTCLEQDVKQYYGKVCDLYAYELTKADKLRMPTFHRFRDDINPSDCTLQKLKDDFLRTLSARSKKGKQRE